MVLRSGHNLCVVVVVSAGALRSPRVSPSHENSPVSSGWPSLQGLHHQNAFVYIYVYVERPHLVACKHTYVCVYVFIHVAIEYTCTALYRNPWLVREYGDSAEGVAPFASSPGGIGEPSGKAEPDENPRELKQSWNEPRRPVVDQRRCALLCIRTRARKVIRNKKKNTQRKTCIVSIGCLFSQRAHEANTNRRSFLMHARKK